MIQTPLQSLLKRMVSFQSTVDKPSEKERCLDWVEDTFFHDRSEHVVRDACHNHCPYLYKKHPKSKILLFGHIDVVPADEDQFTLRVKGDKAWGRGAKDMKGAVLSMLMAYRQLSDSGKPPPASILLTSDEEVMGKTIPMLLKDGTIDDPVAYTPDNADPPDIIVAQKGSIGAKLTATGLAAHSARPWNGRNAIRLLNEALSSIANRFPAPKQEVWTTTVEPTMLGGGEATNKIPGEATCTLSIRYVPEEYPTPHHILRTIRALLPKGCSLKMMSKAEAFKVDKSHALIQKFHSIAEDVLGTSVRLNHSHGASDVRHFSKYNIPSFLYGPTGGGLHADGEWVSLRSLQQQTDICKELLQSL